MRRLFDETSKHVSTCLSTKCYPPRSTSPSHTPIPLARHQRVVLAIPSHPQSPVPSPQAPAPHILSLAARFTHSCSPWFSPSIAGISECTMPLPAVIHCTHTQPNHDPLLHHTCHRGVEPWMPSGFTHPGHMPAGRVPAGRLAQWCLCGHRSPGG